MAVPCLMITYNRLEYTKQALKALLHSDCGDIYIIDQNSNDGTQDYLRALFSDRNKRVQLIFNEENKGIAAATNTFLGLTKRYTYVGKVDNDTLVPVDWCTKLLKYMDKCDMVQARHHIIPATDPNGWEGFTKNMKREGSLLYNHFIGGSGIIFRRACVNHIPETENKLQGWREFQRQNPDLIKAFAEDVEIKLLDEHGYEDYKEYYKQTGRLLV